VVCAADEDEIESLVTSVVCQRYVWNIAIPVVGVLLSMTGTTASIVVGWSEVDTSTPEGPVSILLVCITLTCQLFAACHSSCLAGEEGQYSIVTWDIRLD
jgi:hypothetical protein